MQCYCSITDHSQHSITNWLASQLLEQGRVGQINKTLFGVKSIVQNTAIEITHYSTNQIRQISVVVFQGIFTQGFQVTRRCNVFSRIVLQVNTLKTVVCTAHQIAVTPTMQNMSDDNVDCQKTGLHCHHRPLSWQNMTSRKLCNISNVTLGCPINQKL